MLNIKEANKLVEDSLGLAYEWANRKYLSNKQWGLTIEDLESMGMFGLIDASRNFDPTRAKFSTFANLKMNHILKVYKVKTCSDKRYNGRLTISSDFRLTAGRSDTNLVDVKELVAKVRTILTKREWKIIYARIWEGKTLEVVGTENGVTKERIRQIIDGILKKCSRYLDIHNGLAHATKAQIDRRYQR